MSQEQIKENKNVTVLVTDKEFNNIQQLAITCKESLIHYWKDGGVSVTLSLSFIIQYGFLDLIEF